ncbi:hypothetical protein ESA94_14595 [Lacibacter luteus]|uniref:Uncharacterized protein n=1 Tax=Lacibacter luteus TaxID=2508719 RepID=A0A4Q1CGS1_9BACT|nr:hypothetical protein [Lacibacter luteus]RXK59360.1 hypothetical protein ESA94_14595 [Lacibacter luteus]
MASVVNPQIHITSDVYDFMFIRINDSEFNDSSLQYSIQTNDGELIRKGVFRGAVIQLRLSHLADGLYNIVVQCSEELQPFVYPFKKHTPAKGEQTMFDF